jgi:4-hydroxy-tetrahydrodipicolinate reductase
VSNQPIKVIVAGAAGRMGQEVLKAVTAAADLEVVAAIDPFAVGKNCRELLGSGGPDVDIIAAPHDGLVDLGASVLVDFSNREGAVANANWAIPYGISPVIGATGMDSLELDELAVTCDQYGTSGLYAPNFAVGAVLMMHFAELAAKWLPNAEIIEMHHNQKVDAPSGTAMRTAELIAAARHEDPAGSPDKTIKAEGARGGNVQKVPVHSVRLPGFVAHQEVIFGGVGEVLSIRHDSIDRTSFMHGVTLACRQVKKLPGFEIGLDKLLF